MLQKIILCKTNSDSSIRIADAQAPNVNVYLADRQAKHPLDLIADVIGDAGSDGFDARAVFDNDIQINLNAFAVKMNVYAERGVFHQNLGQPFGKVLRS